MVEGQATNKQDIQDHTAAPHIDLGPGVQLAINDLGSRVVGRAAAGFQEVTVGHDVAQAEIGNLDIEVVVKQQILGLEIAVDDLVAMAVLDSA